MHGSSRVGNPPKQTSELVAAANKHLTDKALFWPAALQFGRFGWFAEAVWAFVGLVPAVLAFTGVFICCRRAMLGKPSI
jgi:uncharacterized iron-regulated membrane protein